MRSRKWRGLYQFLLNKWYFDELFDILFVRTAFWLGRGLWKKGDGAVIDNHQPAGRFRGDLQRPVVVEHRSQHRPGY